MSSRLFAKHCPVARCAPRKPRPRRLRWLLVLLLVVLTIAAMILSAGGGL